MKAMYAVNQTKFNELQKWNDKSWERDEKRRINLFDINGHLFDPKYSSSYCLCGKMYTECNILYTKWSTAVNNAKQGNDPKMPVEVIQERIVNIEEVKNSLNLTPEELKKYQE